jgi:hypothetical protein
MAEKSRSLGFKIMAGSVAGFLVAVGLCGVSMKGGSENSLSLALAGLLLLALSIFGMIVGFIAALVGNARRSGPPAGGDRR